MSAILNMMKYAKFLGFGNSANSGGGDTGGGEMTDVGAEIYVVMQGMCMPFNEFMVSMEGGTPAAVAGANTNARIIVREEPPTLSLSQNESNELGGVFCVQSDNGRVHMWVDAWLSMAELLGFPEHGWIDKPALEGLDYADESNMGLYAVRTVRYPMFDGTLTDLVCDLDKVGTRFERYTLLKTVNLTNATIIGTYAFYGCSSLASVSIPCVTAIGHDAFRDCTSLNSVNLPSSLIYVGADAFRGCTALTDITFGGTIAQWNAIEFLSQWKYGVPATEVVCSDGVVSLV